MNILVVDDEPLARDRLEDLLHDLDPGCAVTTAADGAAALAAVHRQAPDIVLLDIRMPGMDGLEVARHLCALQQPPAVIFTTAYDQHALAAFDSHAVGYLLKPVRRERLAAAIEHARGLTRAQLAALAPEQQPSAPRSHLSATTRLGVRRVPIAEVRLLRAEQKYVAVYTGDEQLLIDESLHALEAEFARQFLRVHRNALVNVAFISGLERDEHGHQYVVLRGLEERVEVSRRLATEVKRQLKAR